MSPLAHYASGNATAGQRDFEIVHLLNVAPDIPIFQQIPLDVTRRQTEAFARPKKKASDRFGPAPGISVKGLVIKSLTVDAE